MKNPEVILSGWLNDAPAWVREAFHNDVTINRLMTDCAILEMPANEMLWRLSWVLYSQRNDTRKLLLEFAEKGQPTIIISKENYERA